MRCCWFVALFASLLLGLTVVTPACAYAPEPEKDKHAEKDAATAGDHKAEHKEDKDMFGKALDLTIWTWVVFLILMAVLTKYAWKPMLEGLRSREHNIHAAIEEAQKAREDAQKLRAQLQAEMDRAQEQVRGIVEEGRKAAQVTADDIVNKARTEVTAERDRLRRDIEVARDQALQQIWSQAAQVATLISSKAIRRHITVDDHRRLVDEAVAELGQAGKDRQRELASVKE